MIIKRYLVVFLALAFLYSCDNGTITEKKTIHDPNKIEKQQKALILNKKIKSIDLIVGDSINLSNRTIFLYDGFDCETCINVGFEMTKKIDFLSKKQMVYIITTSISINRDQLKNDYYNYIFYDENDKIRQELKYVYTPILIKFNDSGEIKDVFFPSYEREATKEMEFINLCLNK